ncbi:MAG: hypothetical protein GX613_14845 [Chloroflexi bacterium]|nr:hypothetical protein [Chloroflexota bacterium]
MSTLYRIHSDWRWIIVLLAVAAIVRLAIGLFGRQEYDRSSRILTLLFSISVDIQVLIGLVYFVWQGIENDLWPRYRFEHLAVMVVAAIVAHLPARWRGAPEITRYRNGLLVVLATMVIIFVGVVLLPGGVNRWEPNF